MPEYYNEDLAYNGDICGKEYSMSPMANLFEGGLPVDISYLSIQDLHKAFKVTDFQVDDWEWTLMTEKKEF